MLSLGIFSGANNFKNLSYENEFKATFGFSFEELEQNLNVKNIMINLLVKHKYLNLNDDDEVKNVKFEQYLIELFKQYDGFCFTCDTETKVISPISFINHINYLEKQNSNYCPS